ncbi:2-oxoglutarate and iron-dependent oxygenase domain containing protein 2 [Dissostichus eleginoides]|uniref:2-oxoglutarate and iron-dependent oxygenase domain containing protein 2 n=1 Tax=Dissostichus eleginoides TaxID=100907 RepID=A0AAD9FBZ3_DISEL|nr:2-oxoglutarate and iron-dependent oxygenase domain containing protein 2 [Dissostichus eleginoides]
MNNTKYKTVPPAPHVSPFITIDSHVSVEAARVYRFPVFERSFCEPLVEELEHFEQSSAPKGRPNTMNHYGSLSQEICEAR